MLVKVNGEDRDVTEGITVRALAGMRDRLIHGYDVVRVDRIYDAVTKVIPPLIPVLESILRSLPDPE